MPPEAQPQIEGAPSNYEATRQTFTAALGGKTAKTSDGASDGDGLSTRGDAAFRGSPMRKVFTEGEVRARRGRKALPKATPFLTHPILACLTRNEERSAALPTSVEKAVYGLQALRVSRNSTVYLQVPRTTIPVAGTVLYL